MFVIARLVPTTAVVREKALLGCRWRAGFAWKAWIRRWHGGADFLSPAVQLVAEFGGSGGFLEISDNFEIIGR